MKVTLAAASALVACATWAVAPARAADLDYGRIPSDRYSSPYEDPRYRDLYGPSRPAERYTHREEETYERAPEPPPVYVPPRYSAVPTYPAYPAPGAYRGECLPRREIRDRLAARGWHHFREVALRRDVAVVHARRGEGELFLLNIDRCTGEITHARLLGPYAPRPYAYGPRRWEAPYYR